MKTFAAFFWTALVGTALAVIFDWAQIPVVASIAVMGAFIVYVLDKHRS